MDSIFQPVPHEQGLPYFRHLRLERRFAVALLLGVFLGGIAAIAAGEGTASDWNEESSASELEARVEAIDAELDQLARLSLRSGVGSIGYRSDSHPENSHPEWIQIDLGREEPIDQIILVPSLTRDGQTGVGANSFPLEFRIVAGNNTDPEDGGEVIASFDAEDNLLPRIAPLVVTCPGVTASWIRVEASVLSPRAWDGRFELQFSEILIFKGQENIAQQMPVKTSSSGEQDFGSRRKEFLVDGFMPYLMDAALGEKSIAFVSWLKDEVTGAYQLVIDLGSVVSLNRVHLHSMEVNDNIPQGDPSNFGMPRRVLIEGAREADFSDAVSLVKYEMKGIQDSGPIIMRRFPETPCRYVRLVAPEPYVPEWGYEVGAARLGFAEIELFAQGKNVAVGKAVSSNGRHTDASRPFSALTDGRNLYGQILPLRDWLNELGKRHDLERERPRVLAAMRQRYDGQQQTLTRLKWLSASAIVGILIAILIAQIIRQRAVLHARQRIGADLHDELGANLHAIGLLGDLAVGATESPERLQKLLLRLNGATARTINSARYCTNLLEAKNFDKSLMEDVQRASARFLTDLEHDLSFEGEAFLNDIKPQQRLDVLLFYKECLINILRHSGATRVRTEVVGTNREIRLSVTDNGQGLGEAMGNSVPASLRRRARLLGARVSVESSDDGNSGTRICLRVRNRKPWNQFWKKRS